SQHGHLHAACLREGGHAATGAAASGLRPRNATPRASSATAPLITATVACPPPPSRTTATVAPPNAAPTNRSMLNSPRPAPPVPREAPAVAGVWVNAMPTPMAVTAATSGTPAPCPPAISAARPSSASPSASRPNRSARRGLHRSVRSPASGASSVIASGSATTTSPATAADVPACAVRWSGTVTSVAVRQNIWQSAATDDLANRGPTSREGGMNGSALRRSTSTNATSPSTPAAAAAHTRGEVAPSVGTADAATSSRPAPVVSVSTPARSSRVGRGGVLVTHRSPPANATTANGLITAKTARQPSASVTRPPTVGPAACPAPLAAAHHDTARPLRAGPAALVSSASTVGSTSAPPTPWTARNATSTARFGESAAPAAPNATTAIDTRNSRRLPNRSPSQPPIGSMSAHSTLNATTTSAPPAIGASRSATIVASGTLTSVFAIVLANVP